MPTDPIPSLDSTHKLDPYLLLVDEYGDGYMFGPFADLTAYGQAVAAGFTGQGRTLLAGAVLYLDGPGSLVLGVDPSAIARDLFFNAHDNEPYEDEGDVPELLAEVDISQRGAGTFRYDTLTGADVKAMGLDI